MEQLMEGKMSILGVGKKGFRRLLYNASHKIRLAMLAIYVLPMVVLTYLYVQYIYPMFSARGDDIMGLGISAVLSFGVILSILGTALISRTANDSVHALKNINDNMDNLLSMTKRFEETGYVDSLVGSAALSAREMLNSEASSLLLYDDRGDLRFEYVEGPAAGFLKGKAIKPGEGITGWVAQEKRPVIINDARSDPRFICRFDNDSGFITKSILCVPLAFSGRDLGVLEVINKRNGQGFDDQDQQLLVSIAGHAAASIYKNKVYEEMKNDFVHVTDILVTSMDNYMPEKKGHARRVARYSIKLAKGLGLTEEDIRKIYFGALLHDIGLLKMDLQEYQDKEKFKLHPTLGADMVRDITQWKDVTSIIRDHHERYDGKGYPAGLSGQEISLGARVIGLAEAFDVMTSRKSYKPSMKFSEVSEEIRTLAGYQFDPQVAQVFMNTFRVEDVFDD
jgi:putative nucleotidyltransferase with HDIG domain